MAKTQIIIVIEGGVVTNVYASDSDVEVKVNDLDNVEDEASEQRAEKLSEQASTMHQVY